MGWHRQRWRMEHRPVFLKMRIPSIVEPPWRFAVDRRCKHRIHPVKGAIDIAPRLLKALFRCGISRGCDLKTLFTNGYGGRRHPILRVAPFKGKAASALVGVYCRPRVR